ncbi:Neurotransmitter-gated ion-channel ligand-binding domain [Trinorchestia longiramus]|nr:Neurotransmitter-gated ion-channel ligand-binding domain [Trinorchestia longiramus]
MSCIEDYVTQCAVCEDVKSEAQHCRRSPAQTQSLTEHLSHARSSLVVVTQCRALQTRSTSFGDFRKTKILNNGEAAVGYCLDVAALPFRVASTQVTEALLGVLRDPTVYDKDVMPDSRAGPVNVSIQIYFRNGQVDDLKEEVKVDMTFRMKWHDPRLKIDRMSSGEGTYGAINNPDLVWLPDPFFRQAVETEQQKTINPQSYLRIYRDEPNMLYSTRIIVKFSCAMNFSAYPHDTQFCSIPIASYGFTADNIELNFDDSSNAISFKPSISKNFGMVGLDTDRCDSITATGKYSCVRAVLELKRQSDPYITNVYVPSACLVIVAFMSEFIPRKEFLAKMLLVLACFLVHYQSAKDVEAAAPVASYVKAIDCFMGVTQLILFSLLLKVIVCSCSIAQKNEKAAIIDHMVSEVPRTLVERARTYLGLVIFGLYVLFLFSYYCYVCSF